MIGRRAIAGLSLLSVLLFCAIAAQGASAAAHTSNNTTAYTCVKGGGSLDFEDAHCDKTTTAGKGGYGHVLIPAEPTTIEINNETTGGATVPFTFTGEVSKVKVVTTCTTVKSTTESEGKKSVIENGGTGTEHKVTGTVTLDLEGCSVPKPEKCTMKSPVIIKTIFKGVDELNADKKGMGLEFIPDGSEAFASLMFEGAECPLKGNTWSFTGSFIATGAPGDNAKESGATWIPTEGNSEDQKLTVAGKKAEVFAAFTMRMHTLDKTGNPITLTTTT